MPQVPPHDENSQSENDGVERTGDGDGIEYPQTGRGQKQGVERRPRTIRVAVPSEKSFPGQQTPGGADVRRRIRGEYRSEGELASQHESRAECGDGDRQKGEAVRGRRQSRVRHKRFYCRTRPDMQEPRNDEPPLSRRDLVRVEKRADKGVDLLRMDIQKPVAPAGKFPDASVLHERRGAQGVLVQIVFRIEDQNGLTEPRQRVLQFVVEGRAVAPPGILAAAQMFGIVLHGVFEGLRFVAPEAHGLPQVDQMAAVFLDFAVRVLVAKFFEFRFREDRSGDQDHAADAPRLLARHLGSGQRARMIPHDIDFTGQTQLIEQSEIRFGEIFDLQGAGRHVRFAEARRVRSERYPVRPQITQKPRVNAARTRTHVKAHERRARRVVRPGDPEVDLSVLVSAVVPHDVRGAEWSGVSHGHQETVEWLRPCPLRLRASLRPAGSLCGSF